MSILSDDNINKLKNEQLLIGVLNVYSNEKLKEVTKKS